MPSPSVTHPCPPLSADALVEKLAGFGVHLRRPGSFDDTGLDFRVLHAADVEGTEWIVRAPRRSDVVETAQREARLLAALAGRLPVRVPEWRVHTAEVIAYPKLPGTPIVTVKGTGDPSPTWNIVERSAPPQAFIDSFACTLAALQAIDPASLHGITAVRTIEEVRTELAATMQLTRPHLNPSEATWARWQRWIADDACWPRHVALAHGDLHPGHLLVERDGTLCGVLDWTEAEVSDPALDFAMLYGCFGAGPFPAFVAAFERAGGRTWPGFARHAAERWHAFPVLGAAWALRTGQDSALAYARTMLEASAAEDAP